MIARGNPGTPSQPQGIGANRYGPQLNVTRGQMASFIARMIDASSVRERTDASIRELPAPAAANPFPGDVPNNYTHLDNIKRLFQAGIVNGNPGTQQQPNGIGADRYGPDLFVTRSQMASFINRAVAYATGGNPANAGTAGNGFVPPANAHYYDDPQQQVHVRNVNAITSVGISNGVGGKRYDGLGNVTRQQMARFIARSLSVLFDDQDRIFSVLEPYTAAVTADGRGDQGPIADGGGRNVGFEGLNPATEYRVTLVKCENVTRDAFGRARFVPNNGVANTGNPDSRIVGLGFGQSGDSVAPTQSTTVTGRESFSVRIENPSDSAECVVAVIYVNGGPGKSLSQGGSSTALEVDNNGYPREFFGISGQTRFAAKPATVQGQATITFDSNVATQGGTATGTATSTTPSLSIASVQISGACVENGSVTRTSDSDSTRTGFQFVVPISGDAGLGSCTLTIVTTFQNGTTDTDTVTITIQDGPPRIVDAFVATDTADTADDSDTASDEDVFRLIFSERIATDGSTATQTATFEDVDGDEFTVECTTGPSSPVTPGNTRAMCVLSPDGRTLDITLLEDPVVGGSGDGVADFPLLITEITGFSDVDGTPNPVDLANSPDTEVDRDDRTQDA